MSFRFIGPLLWAGLLISSAATQAVTPAMAATTCEPTKMKILVTTTGTFSSNSTTFVPIAGASFSFTQGGTKPSCVVVRFSAASSVVGGSISHLQPVLDNVTFAEPNNVQFSGQNVSSVAHAFEFVFPSVAPGSHTLRMLVRAGNASSTVFIDERTTVAQFAP